MSVASPPDEDRYAMRMNMGIADRTYEATASKVTNPTMLINTVKSFVINKMPMAPATPREKAMGIPRIKNISRQIKGSSKSIEATSLRFLAPTYLRTPQKIRL
jgi:hypothetical protein